MRLQGSGRARHPGHGCGHRRCWIRRCRAAVAWPGTRRCWRTMPRGVEAEGALEGGCGAFLVGGGGDDGGVGVQHDPSGERLPATVRLENPPRRRASRFHTWRRALALALLSVSRRVSSMAARVRCRAESEAGAPRSGMWCVPGRSAPERFCAPRRVFPNTFSGRRRSASG